jgi:hypothetical protein
VFRFSEVVDWWEQIVLGIPEVESILREKSLIGLEKAQKAKIKSFLQTYAPF